MTTSTQVILTRATILLQDPTFVRWPLLELFNYISDGQREICLFKPNAYVTLGNLTLVQGTKQTLPATGLALLDVVRNMGVGGSTPGNAVRVVSREILDSQYPGWHSATGDAVVKHYVYNPLDPTHFYVYPPQPVSPAQVEALYGAVPDALTPPGTTAALSDFSATNITLPDIYLNPLINYVLYRAYSKDAEYAQNGALAQKYYELFLSEVTGKTAVEQATNPNIGMGGFNPNTPGGAK